MDDVLSQLVAVAFDMPFVPAKRIQLIKLLNMLTEDIHFPYPLRVGDFGDERDRKKWVPFLSSLIHFIECQSKLELKQKV